jgi:TIR domain/WD domain, G-beta repeat
MNVCKDLFISYGRRESLAFVGFLHRYFKLRGYEGWFDKVNIPDGDDYSQRIWQGIESAHNFVYVMAPRCMTSAYCLVELEYARFLGKRVIPVAQMAIFDTPPKSLSDGDKAVMSGFYESYGISGISILTEKDVLDRSHALLGKTDWVYGRNELDAHDIKAVFDWQAAYENNWHRHEDIQYLQKQEVPLFGKIIDTPESVAESVIKLIEKQKNYVQKHTDILRRSLDWKVNDMSSQSLMVGQERKEAEEWLLTNFVAPEQPPCVPSVVHTEFICESRKNAENLHTDVFVAYAVEDRPLREKIRQNLSRHLITSWIDNKDIRKGSKYEEAIQTGIEQADTFLFFLSPQSLVSEFCLKELEYAFSLHKRIIPIKIRPIDLAVFQTSELLKRLGQIQFIDLTDNTNEQDFGRDISDLLFQLRLDSDYFLRHKIFLTQALKWQRQSRNTSLLLRGHNLEQAKIWLKTGALQTDYKPTLLHEDFIRSSSELSGQTGTEVFVSYSRKDSDFARKLNLELQLNGQTTWFDQESIASGSDFQLEINRGIENSLNFLFLISPDSVISPYCKDEVLYAKKQGKRMISVLCRPTDLELIPIELRERQWIDFSKGNFQKQFLELLRTLEIDRDHVAAHTRWQQRASEWENNHRSPDYLLNATAYQGAAAWLTSCGYSGSPLVKNEKLEKTVTPPPTELQLVFVAESGKAIALAQEKARKTALILRKRFQFSIIALGVAAVLMVVAAYGFYNANQSSLRAQRQSELTQKEKEKAEIAKNEADKAKEKAIESAQQAQIEKEKADTERQKAQTEKENALRSQNLAIEERKKAQNAQFQAEIANVSAEKNRSEAERNAAIAGRNAAEAKNQKDKARENLFWFNAKELAVKSKQMQHDKVNKALLALGSYLLVDSAFISNPQKKQYPLETIEALQDAYSMFVLDLRNTKHQIIGGEVRSLLMEAVTQRIAYSREKGQISIGKLKETSPNNYPDLEEEVSYRLPQAQHILTMAMTTNVLAVGTSEGQVWAKIGSEKWLELYKHPKATVISMALIDQKDKRILVSAGSDKTLCIQELDENTPPFLIHLPDVPLSLQTVGDRLWLGLGNGELMAWNADKLLPDAEPQFRYSCGSPLSCMSFLPQKEWLAVAFRNGELLFLNTRKTNEIHKIQNRKHKGLIRSMCFSPDGNWLASAGLDNSLKLWDLRNTNIENNFNEIAQVQPWELAEESQVLSVCFDSENRYLIYSNNQQLHILSMDVENLVKKLKLQSNLRGKQIAPSIWNIYIKGDLQKPDIQYER